jgi:hypothetical protein
MTRGACVRDGNTSTKSYYLVEQLQVVRFLNSLFSFLLITDPEPETEKDEI